MPLIRRDGALVEASWEEAFAEIDARLTPILADGDRNATAIYLGNPNAHTLDGLIHLRALIKALGTRNIFSATSVDQLPKHVSSALMFGTALSVPIPDVDNTDHLLILGANPLASNGSLMTAPDMRGRLRKLRERGGRLVVVDPRRSRTAEVADEHHFIRPGRDAHLLAALAQTILAEGLARPGVLAEHLDDGLERLPEALAAFAPEAVAATCGIAAGETAGWRASSPRRHARPSTRESGRPRRSSGHWRSWLVDVLNAITGNLDRPGGAMVPARGGGAAECDRRARPRPRAKLGRWVSRVRELPESFGELRSPASRRRSRLRGWSGPRRLHHRGNPLLSPRTRPPRHGIRGAGAAGLARRLRERDELARGRRPAGASPLERAHYDLAFYQLSIRTSRTSRHPACRCARALSRSGGRCCASPRSPPAPDPTPTSTPSTRWWPSTWRAAKRSPRAPPRRAWTPPTSSWPWASAVGPSGSST